MPSNIITTFLVCFTLACTSTGLTGPSKKVGDGRRPSEGGEGVGGYLRDSNDVRYERTDNKVIVAGDSGSIVSDSGNVDGLEICLIGVSEELLRKILVEERSLSGDGVEVVARSKSASDGSFYIEGDLSVFPQGNLITLDVTGFCATDRLPLKNASKSVVFKNPDSAGGFADVSSYIKEVEEDTVDTSEGEVFCKVFGKCEKELTLKIIDSSTGESLNQVSVEAFAMDCATKSILDSLCEPVDNIFLGDATQIGFNAEEYYLKFSSPGYKPAILSTSDDLTETIALDPL